MLQQRVGHTVKLLSGKPTGRCIQSCSFTHAALVTPVWRGVALRSLRLAGPPLQHRFLSSKPEDKADSSETLPSAVEKATDAASEVGSTSAPAVASSSDVAVGKGKDAAIMEQPKKVESIDDILIRTHKRELIQRVGPHVERYMPSEDPNAFLLPDSRLEPEERKWQKIFTALPWAVFAIMLATPLLMVGTNLPWLQKRAEAFRNANKAREDDEVPSHLPGFEVVNFGQMPDVLERPFPTMLMIFHPSTFASKLFIPVLRDLSELFRAAGIAVSIAALDLSAFPQPPDEYLWDLPPALSPHMQLVLPRARDGEAGVMDYDGRWNVVALADVGKRLAGQYAPAVPREDLVRLESQLERLRDLLFELVFLDGSAESSGAARGPASKPSWLGRMFGSASAKSASPARGDLADLECEVDFSGGVAAAVSSCEAAMMKAQVDANRQQA